MESNHSWGNLLQPTGQTIVVRVDMGNYYLRNIFKADPDLTQLGSQGIKTLRGIPAGINQKTFAITSNQIDVNVVQRQVWQR